MCFIYTGMSFLSEGHNLEYQRDLQDVFHMLRAKHGENVLVSRGHNTSKGAFTSDRM
jgi:hypothetical protein